MLYSRMFKFLVHLMCLLAISSTQIAAISEQKTHFGEQNAAKSTNISSAEDAGISGRDIVLIIDTSASMAYETSGSLLTSDPGDDPSVCNLNNTCQPMATVKS